MRMVWLRWVVGGGGEEAGVGAGVGAGGGLYLYRFESPVNWRTLSKNSERW